MLYKIYVVNALSVNAQGSFHFRHCLGALNGWPLKLKYQNLDVSPSNFVPIVEKMPW